MQALGDQLQQLCDGSKNELILVAPFIKRAVIERLLGQVDSSVVIRCVTRWWPDEIASGVSDLEVWPLLQQRQNATLFLKQNLHAKYYRADQDCMIGSANLTQTALSWKQRSNLELLIALPSGEHGLPIFEQSVFADAILVDDDIYYLVKEAVSKLPSIFPSHDVAVSELLAQVGEAQTATTQVAEIKSSYQTLTDVVCWLPVLRQPSDLYLVYQGKSDVVTRASFEAATSDLAWLNVPPLLEEQAFNAYVAALLLQQSTIRKVDHFVLTQQRFGAVRQFLGTLPVSREKDFDPSRAWQTLMRWLLHFLPSRYHMFTPNHSEIFGRRQ